MATLGELEREQYYHSSYLHNHRSIYLHMKSGDVYELADSGTNPNVILHTLHDEPLSIKHTDGTVGIVYLASNSVESVEVTE